MKNDSNSIIKFIFSPVGKYLISVIIIFSLIEIILILGNQVTPIDATIWQVIGIVSLIFFILLSSNLNIRSILVVILFYQLFFSFSLQFYYIVTTGSPIYPEAIDVLSYIDLAEQTKELDFSSAIKIISNRYPDLSDYGAPLFLKYVFQIGGTLQHSMQVLIIINSIIQTIISIYVYKLSLIVFKDKKLATWTLLLWSFNMASIFFNVSGLKEPLFCLLCTLTLYSMYKWKISKSYSALCLFIISLISTWFFRYFVSIFFILIFIGFCIIPRLFNKHFILICISATLVCLSFTDILIYFMPELTYAVNFVEATKPNGLTLYIYYLLSFLSPIPKFISNGDTFSIIIGEYAFIKFGFSICALVGSWFLIKKHFYIAYPLIVLSLFTTLLLIFSGAYIDFRFSYVTMPAFFILMLGGFKYTQKYIKVGYLLFSSIIIYLFNTGSY